MVSTNEGSAPSWLWPRLEPPGQVRRLGGGAGRGGGGRLRPPAPPPARIQAGSVGAQPLTHGDSLGPQLEASRQAGVLCIGLVPCQGPRSPFPLGYLLFLPAARSGPSVAGGLCPAAPAPRWGSACSGHSFPGTLHPPSFTASSRTPGDRSSTGPTSPSVTADPRVGHRTAVRTRWV